MALSVKTLKCFSVTCGVQTLDLQGCMTEHSDYYKDILYEQAGEQSLEAIQDEILEHEHKAEPKGVQPACLHLLSAV